MFRNLSTCGSRHKWLRGAVHQQLPRRMRLGLSIRVSNNENQSHTIDIRIWYKYSLQLIRIDCHSFRNGGMVLQPDRFKTWILNSLTRHSNMNKHHIQSPRSKSKICLAAVPCHIGMSCQGVQRWVCIWFEHESEFDSGKFDWSWSWIWSQLCYLALDAGLSSTLDLQAALSLKLSLSFFLITQLYLSLEQTLTLTIWCLMWTRICSWI